MRRKSELPELLAPAGDFECLVAAVRGGADAVYIGGKAFSARAYAKNFDLEEIKRAVTYCHLYGVRLYVTMNTLLYNGELGEALAFARELYLVGVDALIVADLGLVSLLRKHIPELELHASTQMSAHNTLGADEACDLGCTRVVLARELSGKNIKAVTEKCKAETEVFLHGALCVCHSGQCLFSSMIGGRSGNRGECAQPCRLPYNNGRYILSLSDLSLAGHIDELIASGVASLKIEGRMKSPDYVYTVTSIYRLLLDEGRCSRRDEDRRLARAFSRGGFTDGYFVGDVFRPMTGIRTEEDKRATQSEEKGDYTPDRVAVKARVSIRLGEKSAMTLSCKDTSLSVTALGAIPDTARSAPLAESDVKDRLAKMGNTFFSLSTADIELELEDGINLSPSSINALRRDAVSLLEELARVGEQSRSISEPEAIKTPERVNSSASVSSALFLNADSLLRLDEAAIARFNLIFVPAFDYESCARLAKGVYIPPVVMEDELLDVCGTLKRARELGATHALVGNLAHIAMAREAGLVPVGDFRLNVFNSHSRALLAQKGIDSPIVSPELTEKQAGAVGDRAIVYGRIPLMITERCFVKENFGCDKCGTASLTDRKGVSFPIMREYGHRNLILNSAVTYMADKANELRAAGVRSYHFIFTTETPREIARIVSAFRNSARYPFDGQFRRMGKRT